MGIARDNHYVAQAYLRRWANPAQRVWAYRTLVSHAAVPMWALRPVKGLVFWPDLYTSKHRDAETDEFEHWLNSEFETPALAVIDKVEQRHRLMPKDWERLAWYAFIQDQRTPTDFLDSMRRWQTEIPATIDNVLRSAVDELPRRKERQGTTAPEADPIGGCIRVNIRPGSEPNEAEVGAEVLAGRKLWIAKIRHFASPEGVGKVCCDHKWSLAEASDGEAWLTSDHPMIRLNYYHPGKYHFNGGWGSPGTELLLPLTPRYLLYTRIGQSSPPRFTFSPRETRIVQQCLAERAHRWVFATQPLTDIEHIRQRLVDRDTFAAESESMQGWSTEQASAEHGWQTNHQ